LSLIVGNDVGGDVAMITCAAVGVMGFAKTVLFVVAWQLLAKRRSPAESVAESDIAFSRPSAYPDSAAIETLELLGRYGSVRTAP